MRVKTEEVEKVMKACQIGFGGPGALDKAHDTVAQCYGTLGALVTERDFLRRAVANIHAALGELDMQDKANEAPSAEPGWLQRLRAEYAQQTDRINKLDSYIRGGMPGADDVHRGLLRDQMRIMRDYAEVLRARLLHADSEII